VTQPGESGFGWNQLVGEVLAVAAVIGAFVLRRWHKGRRAAARRERPPQQEKVLRPAGYSASCQIEDLVDRQLSALTQALGGSIVLGILCGSFYPIAEGLALGRFSFAQLLAAPNWYVMLPGVAMASLALLCLIRGFSLTSKFGDELRNWRFGLRGEQAVAEKLAAPEVAAAGYLTFNDVPGDKEWNIDHVVVGPGGVFVLETKARARRKASRNQEEHMVLFDGRTLRFPWCDDAKAVSQVEWNAQWVAKFIADFAPKDIMVQPVVVVPGWWVESLGNYPVKAMNAKYLVGYLTRSDRRFTAEQLRPVIRRLDERCRDLEF